MDILFFDKRPMFFFGLAAVLGAYMATGENILMAVILSLMLLAGALVGNTNRKYIFAAVLVSCLFMLLGIYTSKTFDAEYLELAGRRCEISGVIVSVDSIKEEYTLAVVRPKGFGAKKIKVYFMGLQYGPIQGDKVNFKAKLFKPEPPANPGGYDGRKIQYSDGTTAYAYADCEDTYFPGGFTLGRVFGLIRKDIRDKCVSLLGEENGGVLAGMLIGDKTGLDSITRQEFRESGLSHTMAVSGAHIAYIVVPIVFLFSRFGVARRRYYPIIMVIILLFAALTGFQPSVCRASLTAGMMLLGGIISRDTDTLNNIGISASILIAINPFSIYDAGFILSYACVVSILILYKPLAGLLGGNPVMKLLALTLSVQAGVLPATAKLFYSIQVFAVIANLLIFPVRAALAVSGWIMYFVSIISVRAARLIALIVNGMVGSISQVASVFGSNDFSSINLPYIPPWIVIIFLISVFTILNIKKHSMVIALSASFIIIAGMMIFHSPRDEYVFYDSGQADCFIIKTETGRDILIDTGEYAMGNSISYFTGNYIDCIFLTHAHQDHIGGLDGILDRFRVGEVFIPGCGCSGMDEVIRLCGNYGVHVTKLIAGDKLSFDGYVIEVQNPFGKDYLSLNDTSLVLKLTHGDTALLYCGDIEIPAEIDILSSGAELSCDIMKVPHHGAAGSAYDSFFEAATPKIAVVSCGRNCFGHPADEVFELLWGVPVYSTDRHGAVIIKEIKDGYKVTLCRIRTTED